VNSSEPAEFIIEAARRWVDAGADIIAVHGPHRLRPIEIYKGKPIFYSLGNFMFMIETLRVVTPEVYERYNLPVVSTPAELHDFWTTTAEGTPKGFHADEGFWQSVIAVCHFDGHELQEVQLHPIVLGLGRRRTERGVPFAVPEEEGARVLRKLAEISGAYGTTVRIEAADKYVVGKILR